MAQPLQRIAEITEGQWGLATRRQVMRAGVGWSSLAGLVQRGLLDRVAHGVYRIRGSAEPDHLDLRAAWLQLDAARFAWERFDDRDLAVVSHASAAVMYGVGDLRADVHEFTLPHRRQSRRQDVRIHLGRVPSSRWTILRGLPVLRAGWVIGDLLADHIEPSAVAEIAAEVLANVYDYPRVIAEAIGPYASRFGLPAGDGVRLLNHLLELTGYRDRAEVVGMAHQA